MHQYKLIKDPFSEELIQIDIELVSLIKFFWDNGIQTIGCCQQLRYCAVTKMLPKYSEHSCK